MAANGGLAAVFVAHSSCVGWVIDEARRFRSVYADTTRILGKPAAELEGVLSPRRSIPMLSHCGKAALRAVSRASS